MTLGLAIVGYGKMGRLIEPLGPEYGFAARAKFNSRNNLHGVGLTPATLNGVDVAVEFSTPDGAAENIRQPASAGVNVAGGTTGWAGHLPVARQAVTQNETELVWAPNFSVGVNLFIQAVAHTAALFAKQWEYDAWGWTLRKLAGEMRASGYEHCVNLSAKRVGAYRGTHEIGFDSLADTITLRHTARSREGFARGALRAARWVAGKRLV
jgi:4-hydroxy-tetrahydrodipicolinate reductase